LRRAAAIALGSIGDPSSVPAIINACVEDQHTRRETLEALGLFKPKLTTKFLIYTLGKGLTPEEMDAALGSLRRLTHQDFGTDAQKWRAWYLHNNPQEEAPKPLKPSPPAVKVPAVPSLEPGQHPTPEEMPPVLESREQGGLYGGKLGRCIAAKILSSNPTYLQLVQNCKS